MPSKTAYIRALFIELIGYASTAHKGEPLRNNLLFSCISYITSMLISQNAYLPCMASFMPTCCPVCMFLTCVSKKIAGTAIE